MSAAELAIQTRRQVSGVRRTCAALVSAGIVESVGASRHRLYQFRDAHPLAPALRSLFREESDRPARIAGAIRAAARRLETPPVAAWLQEGASTETGRRDGHVVVGILAGARDLDAVVQHLHDQLEDLERAEDITVEIRGYTRADLQTLPLAERLVIARSAPVLGLPPARFDEPPTEPPKKKAARRSHADLDAQALILARAVAEKLSQDPALLWRARDWLSKRAPGASPRELREIEEWEHLLRSTSLPRLQRLLVDPGAWATRLRQSMPFLGMLTSAERDRLLAESAT